MWGLTAVFGMGTGVAPTLMTVGKTFSADHDLETSIGQLIALQNTLDERPW
jgi:hypothetical protein